MSVDLPTGRRGQALAAALTVTVLAALWVGVVGPLADWYTERAELLDGQRCLLAGMQALADALPALRRQGASTAPAGAPGAVLAGDTDALAGATLLGTVQSMGAAAGASLTSSGALPPEAAGASRRIGVRVTLHAAWPVLVHLLQSIEQSTPHLLIDDLQLHADTSNGPASDDGVDATFSVYGFRAAAKAPAP